MTPEVKRRVDAYSALVDQRMQLGLCIACGGILDRRGGELWWHSRCEPESFSVVPSVEWEPNLHQRNGSRISVRLRPGEPFMVVELKDLDEPGGRPGSGLAPDGSTCLRCLGRGWFQFGGRGTRWTCPDCRVEEEP
jgi:hypothetical protein